MGWHYGTSTAVSLSQHRAAACEPRGLMSGAVWGNHQMIATEKLRLLTEDIEALVRRDRELGKRMKVPPMIPFDRAQWFITAVWAYLSGEAKTLDRAMGLSVGSGRAKTDSPDGEEYERSRRAW